MPKPKARPIEGDWFAVPLREGGSALGRIARVNADASVVVGYFFGPRRESIPTLNDVEHLSPDRAVIVRRFSAGGLRRGLWPTWGHRDWKREEWPGPAFGHHDDLIDRYFRQTYPNDDLDGAPKRVAISRDEWLHLPPAGLFGYGVIETHLGRLLKGVGQSTTGGRVGRPVELQHSLYFHDSANAHMAVTKLGSTFRTAVIEINGRWRVTLARPLGTKSPEEDVPALQAIAASLQGLYDGWERGESLDV